MSDFDPERFYAENISAWGYWHTDKDWSTGGTRFESLTQVLSIAAHRKATQSDLVTVLELLQSKRATIVLAGEDLSELVSWFQQQQTGKLR